MPIKQIYALNDFQVERVAEIAEDFMELLPAYQSAETAFKAAEGTLAGCVMQIGTEALESIDRTKIAFSMDKGSTFQLTLATRFEGFAVPFERMIVAQVEGAGTITEACTTYTTMKSRVFTYLKLGKVEHVKRDKDTNEVKEKILYSSGHPGGNPRIHAKDGEGFNKDGEKVEVEAGAIRFDKDGNIMRTAITYGQMLTNTKAALTYLKESKEGGSQTDTIGHEAWAANGLPQSIGDFAVTLQDTLHNVDIELIQSGYFTVPFEVLSSRFLEDVRELAKAAAIDFADVDTSEPTGKKLSASVEKMLDDAEERRKKFAALQDPTPVENDDGERDAATG